MRFSRSTLLVAALASGAPPAAEAVGQPVIEHGAEAAAGTVAETAVETILRFPDDGSRLALRELDGDGVKDLALAGPDGIVVLRLQDDGRFDVAATEREQAMLAWPAGRVGWDFADLDADGTTEVLLLLGDGTVRAHRFLEGRFDEGEVLLKDRVFLPRGISRVRFVRDVDGDGAQDLILPGSGVHRIFFARDGGWSEPIEVSFDLEASLLMGNPSSLSSRMGQDVRVPWFRIEDVDGDGRDDLVAETADRIAFHLARPELASEPTWVLSLEDLRAELPERGDVDFDNLFSALDQRVSWRIADLDGEAANDLIVLLGAKFRIYLDGARSGPDGTPDQVLKSSGNVLWSFVRQVEGDPLLDLQLVRGERISVGRVLRSLILPSSLDFDFYTYRNEGGAFSRKPTRRNRVTLEIPRLLSFMEDAEGFAEMFEEQLQVPAVRVPRQPGAAAEGDGVVDVEGGDLVLFLDCAPAPLLAESVVSGGFDPEGLVETYFLNDFDERGDGAERTVDLGDLLTLDFATGAMLRLRRTGRTPVLTQPLAFEPAAIEELRATDLDGDGTSDLIAVGESEGGWVVQLLVRRPAGR